jgi:predicted O-linked N-acetylglucosamine transferase (SPINDLY family)
MTNAVFLSAVEKIKEKQLTISMLITAAVELRNQGNIDLAIQLYSTWIQENPTDPLLYAVYFNNSASMSDIGDFQRSREALEKAIEINPDFYPAYINLGTVLERLGLAGQAVVTWTSLANRLGVITGGAIKYKLEALKQIGRVLEMNQLAPNAEIVLKQSLEIDPRQIDVAQHFIALRLGQCETPVVPTWEGADRKTLMRGMGPLSMSIYSDDPMLQLTSGWNYNKQSIGYPPVDLREECSKPRPPKQRRRIGYVSSDLRYHAVGFIIGELFEVHNRKDFEIFAYYCGTAPKDDLHDRIKSSVEHWVDITGMDDVTAARRIVDDGIDILVDINGYTRDARTKMFSMRPAPIIVNWLGYPGSLGTPYHNYIVADDAIIPKEYEKYYSEKVLRLPCYQPNDRKRVIAPTKPTRADAKLPEDVMVYCCFNGAQKISQFTLERWMTILTRVPDSVLWLLDGTEFSNKNIVEYANKRGIASERIIFATKLTNPNHLARYPLADLFLDTTPYGAHVTASDALWMGVPILTFPGRCFASRVCGSLVKSAGLPELICDGPDDYIEKAVQLGNNRKKIAQMKKHLAKERDSCVLFDTDLLVKSMEKLYKKMWDEYSAGKLPIPDLSNLDSYFDVGCEINHEAVEVLTIDDYDSIYQDKFSYWHKYSPIRADNRLWTATDIANAESKKPAIKVNLVKNTASVMSKKK